MCCFCHAQPFEITRAKNIKNPLVQRSCQNAEVVEAFCSRRVHHRDRHQHTIPIALAALPGATLPRLRALALFGRRPPQRVDSLLMPASENLHKRRNTRYEQMTSASAPTTDIQRLLRHVRFVPGGDIASLVGTPSIGIVFVRELPPGRAEIPGQCNRQHWCCRRASQLHSLQLYVHARLRGIDWGPS
jgi:hypothetical protein